MAVFLPAYGPEGAALLRIYKVAQNLRDLGWRTLVLPWKLTLAQRHRFLARAAADIVVMQGARHALNRPELYPGQTILFDMDDADFHLPHLAEPIRASMPHVSAVIAGSAYIADWCRAALHLYVAVDRTRKFAVTQLVDKADSRASTSMPDASIDGDMSGLKENLIVLLHIGLKICRIILKVERHGFSTCNEKGGKAVVDALKLSTLNVSSFYERFDDRSAGYITGMCAYAGHRSFMKIPQDQMTMKCPNLIFRTNNLGNPVRGLEQCPALGD